MSILISVTIIKFGYSYFEKISNDQKQQLSALNQIISKNKETLNKQRQQILFLNELYFKEKQQDIFLKNKQEILLSNNKTLIKFELENGFYSALGGLRPGGYIDVHQNKILIMSSRGIISFTKNLDQNSVFKQVKNNINDFINLDQFKKNNGFSLRDLLIYNENIFISYSEEHQKDCWNTSVLKAKMNYEILNFKKLFSSDKCIHSVNNKDKDFGIWQSGGRISNFDNEHILLTVGDYGERYLAQDKQSINGKILKINIKTSDYKIVSMGHRNPQGLYFDEESNHILSTEHGPDGGDEINLIDVNKLKNNYIYNFGWPIVSEGEHYCKKRKEKNCEEIYKKYPLYKSHTNYGFIEPIKSFLPSIAISQITKLEKNSYVVGSMGRERKNDKSIFFFDLSEENKIINFKQVKLNQRVRDLIFHNNKLYLLLEDIPSIGIIDL